jgi:hypothetical protein
MLEQPGIYTIGEADYHADPCGLPSASSSILNILATQSAAHARLAHPRLNPDHVEEETERFDIGKAAHAMLLEDEDRMIKIDPRDYPSARGTIPEGWTNKAIRAARDAARAQGKYPVLADTYQSICDMVQVARSFLAQTTFSELVQEMLAEQTLIWREGHYWCRARPDWLTHGWLVNYKTTDNAHPDSWSRNRLTQLGFDLQAAWYLRGYRALTEIQADYCFLLQEIAPPYACSLVGVSPAMLELGRTKVDIAFQKWRRCLELNNWPAYPVEICWADPQPWQLARQEERTAFDALLGGQA